MNDTHTKEEITERLGQIDKAHFVLTESLDRAPAEFQESTSGDDDANEAESLEQKLAGIRSELEELEVERTALQAELAALNAS